jgi:hypothetical protein
MASKLRTLADARAALVALDPLNDPTVGERKLAYWERAALLSDDYADTDVLNAVSKYRAAGIRFTTALYHAASNYVALLRDSKDD